MASAVNLGVKHGLSTLTDSKQFHAVPREILDTDLKLNMIVYFKETRIRTALKKLDRTNVFMVSPHAAPAHRRSPAHTDLREMNL